MSRIAQLALAIARSAGWAGLALIDPNSLTGWRRHAYWATMAGATAAEVARPAPTEDFRHPGLTMGVALGTAGLTYGARDALAKADAWSIRLMRSIGLTQPRAWAAAGVFVSMLAASVAEARLASSPDRLGDELGEPLPESLQPLPDPVRACVLALLDAVDGYGSDELRLQLDDAVCRPDAGQYLLVADAHGPRTLIHSYTFPASAIFERDGINHVLILEIEEGRLSFLSHLVEPYPGDDSAIDWSMPTPDELRIVVGFEEAESTP